LHLIWVYNPCKWFLAFWEGQTWDFSLLSLANFA
jgi:hypothetical protein